MGFLSPNIIVSGSAQFIETSDRAIFGIVTSAMHMSWMRAVGGRTKSDYQYTNTLVYNTFPWPEMNAEQKQNVAAMAKNVLEVRGEFPKSTLAHLYDPDLMPPRLRKAHHALDVAVDRLYRRATFQSERDRVEFLFNLYAKAEAPILVASSTKARPKNR